MELYLRNKKLQKDVSRTKTEDRVESENIGENEDENKTVLHHCKSALLATCPPDAILRLWKSNLHRDEEYIGIQNISEEYFSTRYVSWLGELVEKSDPQPLPNSQPFLNSKSIVYTKSNIYIDMTPITEQLNASAFKLSTVKTEHQLEKLLEAFYLSKEDVLIIQCKLKTDAHNLLLLKISIDHIASRFPSEAKTIFIVIHLDYVSDKHVYDWQSSRSEDWSVVTVESLQKHQWDVKELRDKTEVEFMSNDIFQLSDFIRRNILWAFSRFQYSEKTLKERLPNLLLAIKDCSPLIDHIKRVVIRICETNNSRSELEEHDNWQVKSVCDRYHVITGKTLFGTWRTYILEIIKPELLKTVLFLEQTSAWHAICRASRMNNQILIDHWGDLFENFMMQSNISENLPNGIQSIYVNEMSRKFQFTFIHMFIQKLTPITNSLETVINRFTADGKGEEIEHLSNIDESDVNDLLQKYSPTADHMFNEFVNNFKEKPNKAFFLEQWESIYADIVLALSENPGQTVPDDLKLLVASTLLGDRDLYEKHCFSERIVLLLLAFVIVEPRIKVALECLSFCKGEAGTTFEQILNTVQKRQTEKRSWSDVNDEIVRQICKHYMPSDRRKETVTGSQLRTTVTLITSYCSQISPYPCELHFLRFCTDVAKVLPDQDNMIPFELVHKLIDYHNHIEEKDDDSGSADDIDRSDPKTQDERKEEEHSIVSTHEHMKNEMKMIETECMAFFNKIENPNKKQRIFCNFVTRCLDNSDDSPILPFLVREMCQYPEDRLQMFAPIVWRIVLNICDIPEFEELKSLIVGAREKAMNEEILDGYLANEEYVHIAVMIADAIESNIELPNGPNDILYGVFEIACKLSTENAGWTIRKLASIAFVKVFLRSVVSDKYTEIQTQQLENNMKHGLYSDGFKFPSPFHAFIVKCAYQQTTNTRGERSMRNKVPIFQRQYSKLKEMDWSTHEHELYGIGYMPLTPSEHGNILIQKLTAVLNDTNIKTAFENQVQADLETLGSDYEKLQTLAICVSEVMYWPKLHKPISVVARDLGKWIIESLETRDTAADVINLIRRLTGQQDFEVKFMNISQSTGDHDMLKASATLAFHIAFLKHIPRDGFLKRVMFGLKDGLDETISFPIHHQSLDIIEHDCKCGFRMFNRTPQQSVKCPVCYENNEDFKETVTQCRTYTAGKTTSSGIIIGKCKYSNILEGVIYLIIQTAALVGMSSKQFNCDEINVEEAIKVHDTTWESVANSLVYTKREMCLFFHMLINELFSKPSTGDIKTADDLYSGIVEILHNVDDNILHYRRTVYSRLDEDVMSAFLMGASQRDSSINIHTRYQRLPTIDLLKCKIELVAYAKPNDFPFLSLCSDWHSRIHLVHHLIPIRKFYTLLIDKVDHKITRNEAKNTTITDFVKDQSELREAYDQFEKSWLELKRKDNMEVLSALMGLDEFPKLERGSYLSDFVAENEHHFLILLMKQLIKIQNDFLIHVASLAMHECKCLSFLLRDGQFLVPVSNFFQMRIKEILHFEWASYLMQFAHNGLQSGTENIVMFDFEAIELELAIDLLGKTFIEVKNISFHHPTYKNEMFHKCGDILVKLNKRIRQTNLTQTMIKALEDGYNKSRTSMDELLDSLEILLPLMLNSGCQESETIGEFAKRWDGTQTITEESVINKQLELYITLSHVEALYEFTEEKVADTVMRSLSEEYRAELGNTNPFLDCQWDKQWDM